jgi:pyocin large subunit-like protein
VGEKVAADENDIRWMLGTQFNDFLRGRANVVQPHISEIGHDFDRKTADSQVDECSHNTHQA